MLRAACATIVQRGFDVFLDFLHPLPSKPDFQDLFTSFQRRAEQYLRGELWPLRHAFGLLARFANGVNEPCRKMRTPDLVATWLSDCAMVHCSCVGRSKHVGHLRREACQVGRRQGEPGGTLDSARDGPSGLVGVHATSGTGADCLGVGDTQCMHDSTFTETISWLYQRLEVSVGTFCRTVPSIYTEDAGAKVGAPMSGLSVREEDWESEGSIEIFRTGQSAVAVAMTGVGVHKVLAPVRCTRNFDVLHVL